MDRDIDTFGYISAGFGAFWQGIVIAWIRLGFIHSCKVVGSIFRIGNVVGQWMIAMIQRKAIGWFVVCMQILALCSIAVALSILYSQL